MLGCLPMLVLLMTATPLPRAQMPLPIQATGTNVAPHGLRLTLSTPQSAFVQGEPIEITARYDYSGAQALVVEEGSLSRQEIGDAFIVRAVDARGRFARDPEPPGGAPSAMVIDRVISSRLLTPAMPFTQTFTLNDWACLDLPGRYTITVISRLIHPGHDFRDWGAGVVLNSPPLSLDILPAGVQRRHQRLLQANADFKRRDEATRFAAIRAATYWDDPAAIPLLIRGLGDEQTAGEAALGLTSLLSVAPTQVTEAVREAVEDPAHLISPRNVWPYLDLLTEADRRLKGLDNQESQEDYQWWLSKYTDRLTRELPHLPPARAVNLTVDGLAFGPVLSPADARNWRRIFRNVRLIDSGRRQSAPMINRQQCRLKSVVPDLKRMLLSLSNPTDAPAYADYVDAAQAALAAMEK